MFGLKVLRGVYIFQTYQKIIFSVSKNICNICRTRSLYFSGGGNKGLGFVEY